jgi:acyl-CoA thioesterase-2
MRTSVSAIGRLTLLLAGADKAGTCIRPAMSALDNLLSILDLEALDGNSFRAENLDVGLPWVFGGQILAQAIIAAGATVDGRTVHSVHGHFLQAGRLAVPLDFTVERTRDGNTFATRSVRARQAGETIFTATASFKRPEPGLEHQALAMPDTPLPEELPDGSELRAELAAAAPAYLRRYWEIPAPIELRPVRLDRYQSRAPIEPHHQIWLRAAGKPPADALKQAAILAFASDMTLLDTALFPHGRTVFDPDMQIASLDHTLWYHRPFRMDEWHLYVQESPSAAGSLGLVHGHIFASDGRLVATVAQQGLIRQRAGETG